MACYSPNPCAANDARLRRRHRVALPPGAPLEEKALNADRDAAVGANPWFSDCRPFWSHVQGATGSQSSNQLGGRDQAL